MVDSSKIYAAYEAWKNSLGLLENPSLSPSFDAFEAGYKAGYEAAQKPTPSQVKWSLEDDEG